MEHQQVAIVYSSRVDNSGNFTVHRVRDGIWTSTRNLLKVDIQVQNQIAVMAGQMLTGANRQRWRHVQKRETDS